MRNRIIHFWRALFPIPEVGALEGFVYRLLLAFVLERLFPLDMMFHSQPVPSGLAHFFDLTWLSEPGVYQIYRQVFVGLLVAMTTGVALPFTLPLVTVLHVLPYTLINSQGSTNHSYQIMSLTLLGLSVTVLYQAVRGKMGLVFPGSEIHSRLLVTAQFVIAAAYLVSVCSKLINSDGAWLFNSHYIALDLMKTNRQNYLTWLRPDLQFDPPLILWLLNHPMIARLIFGAGFLLEAFMFLAIGSRLATFAVGICVIVMHLTIAETMGLLFPSHVAFVGLFWVLPLPLFLIHRGIDLLRSDRTASVDASL
jgi:hypothetical protein